MGTGAKKLPKILEKKDGPWSIEDETVRSAIRFQSFTVRSIFVELAITSERCMEVRNVDKKYGQLRFFVNFLTIDLIYFKKKSDTAIEFVQVVEEMQLYGKDIFYLPNILH